MKIRNYIYTSFLIIVILIINSEGGGQARKKGERSGCFDCHPALLKDLSSRFAHSPAKKEQCDGCHNPHTSKYKNLLNESSNKLCYRCHEKNKIKFKKMFTHLPVEKGECVKCHNPHSSTFKNLLKKERNELCFSCHDKEKIFSRQDIHQPLKGGDCLECHDPHASDDEFLLVKNSRDICAGCHSLSGSDIKKAHRNSLSENVNCLGCHNPHSSNRNYLIRENSHMPFGAGSCGECHVISQNDNTTIKMKKEGKALCLSCHEKTGNEFQRVFSHVQGKGDNICLECHNPHASDYKNLKSGRDDRTCFSCHTDTKRRVRGNDERYKYKHPDIEQCTDCHLSHGSNFRLLLKSDENSSCEECHETQGKFTHPVGDKSVDPRNKRGMTCVTCHNPMGTGDEYSLRFGRQKHLCIQCHVDKK